MFITQFLKEMRKEQSNEFASLLNKYGTMPIETLVQEASDVKAAYYKYEEGNIGLTVLPVHCGYRQKTGGCSFCDYSETQVDGEALMEAIRIKSPNEYAKVLRCTITNVRGECANPNAVELITALDTFNEVTMPQCARQAVYNSGVLSNDPVVYVVEGRAPEMTDEKLRELRSYFGKAQGTIEFGVEVGDEWIRNHWLNKGVTNRHIGRAIKLLHENGLRADPDVIMGLPGLTETQSKQLFSSTIEWLDSLKPDHYTTLPLNRKKHTLQGFLYEHLRNSEELTRRGLVQGEHTGVAWLYTTAEMILSLPEHITNHMNIAQLCQDTNSNLNNAPAYNANPECSCNKVLRDGLTTTKDGVNREKLTRALCEANACECRTEYDKLVLRQDLNNHSVEGTMAAVAKELAKKMWGAEWDRNYSIFEREIGTRNQTSHTPSFHSAR